MRSQRSGATRDMTMSMLRLTSPKTGLNWKNPTRMMKTEQKNGQEFLPVLSSMVRNDLTSLQKDALPHPRQLLWQRLHVRPSRAPPPPLVLLPLHRGVGSSCLSGPPRHVSTRLPHVSPAHQRVPVSRAPLLPLHARPLRKRAYSPQPAQERQEIPYLETQSLHSR